MSVRTLDIDMTSLSPWWRSIASKIGGSGLWMDDCPDITATVAIDGVEKTYRLDSVYQITVFDEMGSVYRTHWQESPSRGCATQ